MKVANQFPLQGARGLGSTSYVTDADGNIAQHIEYIPYGEVFVEERNNSFSTNYLFNAKELDNETGLYYYGARYLDPTGAMWLSVDPMWEKYAGMSPYNYCAGNPVKMVDPDGRENTVFLVDLQTEKKLDVQKFVESVNQALENFGLETRMVMAPDGKDFNPQYMDETDSYIAIGAITDVYNFIKEKSPKEFDLYFSNFGCDFGPNPEKASMQPAWMEGGMALNAKFRDGKKTSVIGIDLGASIKMANECGISLLDYSTYLACHSLGHNAAINHPNDAFAYGHSNCPYHWNNTMIMNSGTKFSDQLKSSSDKMSAYNKFMDPKNNSGYIRGMMTHFGNNKSRSNYEFKRKYHDLYFGK
ncbi:MAG: RHS repeat-associated core domain-containing protein [Paludibacteraceae bacterium]|nr:RHS repeat-associated core domain-containing protein [Paludibacteraceae bacterium]